MSAKRVSITEMGVWQRCHLQWHYQYRLRLKSKTAVLNPYMLSGSAVHFGIEAGLLLGPQAAEDAAVTYLKAEVGDKGERYVKGVSHALKGIPEWAWRVASPQSEMKLTIEVGQVTIVGKPDLWWVDDDGLHVVEFKSTSKNPSEKLREYERWNQQPWRYAVLLRAFLPGLRDIQTGVKHVVLSTNEESVEGEEIPCTPARLRLVEETMVQLAQEVGIEPIVGVFEPFICEGCNFADLDEVLLTGGDWRDKIAREFVERERKQAVS